MNPENSITELLHKAKAGDRHCEDLLVSILYSELRQIASRRLRQERPDHTLQPSALVNEAYLRLAAVEGSWQNRGHFLAAATVVMRNILVDYARQRGAQRRDGGVRVSVEFAQALPAQSFDRLLELDIALKELAELDARHARVVELHAFGGLTFEEIGEHLDISSRTAKRDWVLARAWLQDRMKGLPHESE